MKAETLSMGEDRDNDLDNKIIIEPIEHMHILAIS